MFCMPILQSWQPGICKSYYYFNLSYAPNMRWVKIWKCQPYFNIVLIYLIVFLLIRMGFFSKHSTSKLTLQIHIVRYLSKKVILLKYTYHDDVPNNWVKLNLSKIYTYNSHFNFHLNFHFLLSWSGNFSETEISLQ